jgi:hypothetical protein
MSFPCRAKHLREGDKIDLSATKWLHSEDGPRPPITGWAKVIGHFRNEGNGREGKIDIGVAFGANYQEYVRFSVDLDQYFRVERPKADV